jgi:hypothetical protein
MENSASRNTKEDKPQGEEEGKKERRPLKYT